MTPKLEALLKQAKATVDAMTPEEREAMHAAQRESWVRAELGWPKAKFRRVAAISFTVIKANIDAPEAQAA